MSSERLKVISGGDPFDPPPTAAVVTPLSGTPSYRLTPAAGGRVKQTPDNVRWLRNTLGVGPLSWAFLRGGKTIRVACIGESGYIEPVHGENGPATVAPLTGRELSTRIADNIYCYVADRDTGTRHEEWFPVGDCERALDTPDQLPHLRPLTGVTHTPVLHPDRGVLAAPGYDAATDYLHVPDVGVPDVPATPTATQLYDAVDTVRGLLVDFTWAGEHHEVNFIGAMLTPLLRLVCPPPYKLVAIGAHQRGSGKSLLAKLLRILHGGGLRTWPGEENELGKQVTSVLTQTTAPCVQIDNVRGVIRSPKLEGLLTTRTITDRVLGSTNNTEMTNDRLWIVTGNNMALSGDLGRRTLWVMIDPGVERPEDRTDFKIADLAAYVTEHRAEILHALIIILASWDAAGRPKGTAGSDDYAHWIACIRGILTHAGIPGVFAHADSEVSTTDADADEWGQFLRAVQDIHEDGGWTVRELTDRMGKGGGMAGDDLAKQLMDALPSELFEKAQRTGPQAVNKSLGRWLTNREGQWFGGLTVRRAGTESRSKSAMWKIVGDAEGGDSE